MVLPPLGRIHNTLRSVSSRSVRTIILDLNAKGARDAFGQEYLQSFRRLDADLHQIASAYRGIERTVVKLSAHRPFAPGLCLRHFRRHGKLILGARSGEGSGDVQWFKA